MSSVVQDTDCATFVAAPAVTALVTMLHQLAEQHVCDYLGWQQIVEGTWTEFYPQVQADSPVNDPHYIVESNHQRAIPGYYLSPNTIQLRQLPVRSITSVYEDATGYFGQTAGSFAPGTLLQPGSDYFLKFDMPASSGSDNLSIASGGAISLSGHLVRRAFYFPAIVGSGPWPRVFSRQGLEWRPLKGFGIQDNDQLDTPQAKRNLSWHVAGTGQARRAAFRPLTPHS